MREEWGDHDEIIADVSMKEGTRVCSDERSRSPADERRSERSRRHV